MRTSFQFVGTALCLAWGGSVLAQEPDFVSPMLGLYEAGVLCAQDSGIVQEAPNTVSGTTHVVDTAPEFVSQGRIVPAVLGVGFGAQFGVAGQEELGQVTIRVTHPPFEGSGVTEQSFDTRLGTATAPGLSFYQFDYPYELRLGEWTMSASNGVVTFYEATFMVVHPSEVPELAGVCGFLDLIG